ncbi:YybH family protein [Wenyingzhuangia sp. IMCC45574]
MKQLAIILFAITVLSSCQDKEKSENLIKNTETMEKLAKQEIESLLMIYKETLNTSNAEKATSLYTKDGIFMPTGAPSAIGSESILKSYEFVFSQIQLNIEFFIEEIEVEGNMAFAVTSSKGTVKIHANGVEAPEANRELFVLEKVGGEWKIARYMFNKTK